MSSSGVHLLFDVFRCYIYTFVQVLTDSCKVLTQQNWSVWLRHPRQPSSFEHQLRIVGSSILPSGQEHIGSSVVLFERFVYSCYIEHNVWFIYAVFLCYDINAVKGGVATLSSRHPLGVIGEKKTYDTLRQLRCKGI